MPDSYTPHYNLIKPGADSKVKIADINGNMDIVDEALHDKLDSANIANNLTTTAGGYALDARQGKALQDGKLDAANVVNNLTTTGAGYALDARQGKALSDALGKIDLLWTNSSPAAAFAPQTVSIPTIGDYDLILIQLKHHTTDYSYSPLFVLHRTHANSWAELKFGYIQNDSGRRAYCAAGGVAFDQGFFRKLDNSYGLSNDYGIPARIYGVKL